jgi:hypothetical protein
MSVGSRGAFLMTSIFNRSLAMGLLLSAAAAWAATPQDKGADAKRNPIQVPGTVWAFDGFLVSMPNDNGWYSTAKDWRYADLSKEFDDGMKAAIVVEARKLDEDVGKDEALLARLKEEQASVPDAG